MRRVLSALTGISLLLASTTSFGQQSANSNVAEFNGANDDRATAGSAVGN